MKKIILITSLTIIFFASFIILKRTKQNNLKAAYTIGILQTASHPALNASRQGFTEELKSKMGDKIEFVIQNAQGSVTSAHTIAQQFSIDKNFNAFFAIATPAAQALSATDKERPIIISAVTDPNALGLIYPNTNVCGVKDMIDVKSQVNMLAKLLPNAKTIGLIYTSGEANSIALVKQMRSELEKLGLTAVDFAVSNEADMPAIVELACRKTDALLAPTDNTVASAITIITSIALKNKKPLIVSDNTLVKFGALASKGVDYKASGKRAAQIAYQVLINNKKPCDLPVEQAKSDQIYINKATMETLGLTAPEELEEIIVFV